MKRLLLTALTLGVFAAGTAFAAENPQMHEMMMKMGGPKPDDRIELKLPQAMKVMQKGMMRRHLDTVSEITQALAVNDLAKASSIASENLGWTPQEEQRCNMVSEMTGEKDFAAFGMAVHKTADELAISAKAGDRDKALADLSRLIKNCNACHEKFRH